MVKVISSTGTSSKPSYFAKVSTARTQGRPSRGDVDVGLSLL
ncbi:MAG TPA: hypothetical protein VLT32_12300 [Candidatus Sulfomarinibacteraceae bacterium]|nr:hypothetical protein [Candidatus Sulfomarinibacteraceae bacterium]